MNTIIIAFLLLYVVFLIVYIAFSSYVVHRAWEMRIEGDKTVQAIYIYTAFTGLTIVLTFIFLVVATT